MRSRLLNVLILITLSASATSVQSALAQALTPAVVAAPPAAPGGVIVVERAPDQPAGGVSDENAQLSALEAQLANEAESLSKQLADTSDEKQKADLKEKLRDTLSRQFDAQQKSRELEVARIEARVKKLRDTISKRNEARRTIIDKRFDQLLSEAEGLGWNSPSGGSQNGRAYYAPQAVGGIGTPGGPTTFRVYGGGKPPELAPVPLGR